MTEPLALSVVALSPAMGLAFGREKRSLAAGVLLAVSAAAWGALFFASTPSWGWAALGLWSACGLLYVAFRGAAQAERLENLEKERVELEAREKKDRESLEEVRRQGKLDGEEQVRAQAVYGVVKTLSEATNLASIRPKIASSIQEYLGLTRFSLFISGVDRTESMELLVHRLMENTVAATWDSMKAHLESKSADLDHPHLIQDSTPSIAIPIFNGSERVGFLFANVPVGKDAEKLLADSQDFTREISFALKRVALFNEVERLSEIDGLTGVYRRAIFDRRIEAEIKRAAMFKTGLCVMILDIDHFKSVNDRYGHPFGDFVLKRVGEILKSCVYETDFVARYGGEEFAILLPRADPIGVLRKAEAIRSTIEQESFVQGLDTIHATVSIGIAHFPKDGTDDKTLIEHADQALYRAKESGRNRVVG